MSVSDLVFSNNFTGNVRPTTLFNKGPGKFFLARDGDFNKELFSFSNATETTGDACVVSEKNIVDTCGHVNFKAPPKCAKVTCPALNKGWKWRSLHLQRLEAIKKARVSLLVSVNQQLAKLNNSMNTLNYALQAQSLVSTLATIRSMHGVLEKHLAVHNATAGVRRLSEQAAMHAFSTESFSKGVSPDHDVTSNAAMWQLKMRVSVAGLSTHFAKL